MPNPGDITQLLAAVRKGDQKALDQLLPLVYNELRLAAHRQMRRQHRNQTLNTTALVHEAYLKLVGHGHGEWRDRGHFLAVASTAMRQILVDTARRRTAQKRGGQDAPETYSESKIGVEDRAIEILVLDEALHNLSTLNGRLARLVELRFFGGLTVGETAEVLGIAERTVKRDWRKARAFLYQALESGAAG